MSDQTPKPLTVADLLPGGSFRYEGDERYVVDFVKSDNKAGGYLVVDGYGSRSGWTKDYLTDKRMTDIRQAPDPLPAPVREAMRKMRAYKNVYYSPESLTCLEELERRFPELGAEAKEPQPKLPKLAPCKLCGAMPQTMTVLDGVEHPSDECLLSGVFCSVAKWNAAMGA